MPIIKVMGELLVITSNDSILATLDFKPYRSKVERRFSPFLPGPDEPQAMQINTPWGAQLTARKGDFLVSEVDTPNDYWSVDPVIFEKRINVIAMRGNKFFTFIPPSDFQNTLLRLYSIRYVALQDAHTEV